MKKLFIILLLLVAAVFPPSVHADIDQTMSYQGRLTDTEGNPLSGSYNLRFYLYTDLTAGTQVWYEGHNSVAVTNGVFNVILGASSNPATFPITLAMRDNLFLEVRVYNGSSWETMSPRHSLVCSAYAMSARNVVNRQVLTVAHDGGDAATVSAAIDMLLGQGAYTTALSPAPTADNQWVIEVKAGTYTEGGTYGSSGTITVPDYVTIRGQGWDATALNVGQIDLSGTKRALESLKINGQYDSIVVINMAGASYSYVREVWSESLAPTAIIDLTAAAYCQILDNHLIGNGPMAAGGILMAGSQYCRVENNYIDLANDASQVTSTTGSYGITDNGTATTQCTITQNTIRYVSSNIASTAYSYGIGLSGTATTTNSSNVSHNVFKRGYFIKDIVDVSTGTSPSWSAPGTGAHGINNQASDGRELTAF